MTHRGLFITGTDTNVGKTIVSAATLHRYRREAPLRYWKPVQTGIEQDDDTREVQRLAACGDDEVLADGVRLPRPVSPHLAASLQGVEIRVDALLAILDRQAPGRVWIVEGAGGVFAPLNRSDVMVDLIVRLGMPAVVVSRSTLGTINHTMLTLEALRSRQVQVAGVVMVGAPDEENRRAIEHYGGAPVLGELPVLDPLDAQALGGWARTCLDRQGDLLEWLR